MIINFRIYKGNLGIYMRKIFQFIWNILEKYIYLLQLPLQGIRESNWIDLFVVIINYGQLFARFNRTIYMRGEPIK